MIKNLRRTSDENLYTNFLQTILQQSKELKVKFFNYLVQKRFSIENYVPKNVSTKTQQQSLIALKRAANSLIRRSAKKKENKMNALLRNCRSLEIRNEVQKRVGNYEVFINGYIDSYLEDENYRIAIENKIYSGIHGKQKGPEASDQIATYKQYLDDLNKTEKQKGNGIVLLVPESEKSGFVGYRKDIVIVTYKDLHEFFYENKGLIKRYCDEFLNALAVHTLTKEQIITARFLEALS